MSESPPPPERLLCQIGVFAPVLSLPLLLGGAAWSAVRRRGEVLRQRWPRRLLGLTLADCLVAAGLLVMLQSFAPRVARDTIGGPLPTRRVIGIRMDRGARGRGVRVEQVLPESPAARAGLRAGDVLLAVDGQALAGPAELPPTLARGAEGAARRLQVRRDGRVFEVKLVPVAPDQLQPQRPGLFEATPAGAAERSTPVGWRQVLPLGGSIVLLLLLGRWRGVQPPGRYALFTLLPAASMGLGLLATAGLVAVVGASLGTTVLGMLLAEAALFLAAAAFLPGLRQQGTLELCREPRLSVMAGVGLGLAYLMVGGLRVALVLAGVMLLLDMPRGGGANAELQAALAAVQLGLPGLTLLFALGVVVGPAAEEVYFRGALLPWLARHLGTPGALWVTALIFGGLHAHYGLGTVVAVYYGYVLGWARLRTGGLWTPFLLHAAINLAGGSTLLGG